MKSVFLFMIFSLFFQSQKTHEWMLYTDAEVGYSIEYPSHWKYKGGGGGFICGKEAGFKNAQWQLWHANIEDIGRIDFIFNDAGLWTGYDITEKDILINGIPATLRVLTHPKKPDEYVEEVVVKTKSIWYSITNEGIYDKDFKHFYMSFRLLE